MKILIELSRVSAGTVFTDNGGFRLLLGQPNEFPLLQVFGLKATFLSNMRKLIFDASKNNLIKKYIFQARHIPLIPGKEHIVEVGGTHISTASSYSMWNLEGCTYSYIFYKKIKKKDPFFARSHENEKYRPKRTKMSLLLGVRDFGISLKVTFVFNFWPVSIFLYGATSRYSTGCFLKGCSETDLSRPPVI